MPKTETTIERRKERKTIFDRASGLKYPFKQRASDEIRWGEPGAPIIMEGNDGNKPLPQSCPKLSSQSDI